MHNVPNQFEINLFQKKQRFINFCSFAHFFSTCYKVLLKKNPMFLLIKHKLIFVVSILSRTILI